jgi:formylglycine-generating enzyme required for sulfatase activity
MKGRQIWLMVLLMLLVLSPVHGAAIEMVPLAGGCFQMGTPAGDPMAFENEQPAHEVCVDSFSIGKYEVTQGEWQAVMGDNPSYFRECSVACPVEQVSWNDAQLFIVRLNSREGKRYRLPTEAEWEYASRGGSGKGQVYAGTDERIDLPLFARYVDNSSRRTGPVGEFRPNLLGIYDLSGNVAEWVGDRYDATYYAVSHRSNPAGPASGAYRVFRGGSYASGPIGTRTTDRSRQQPDFRYQGLGFRLVLPGEGKTARQGGKP